MYKVGSMKETSQSDHKVPCIKLSGNWLSEAGFNPNDGAEVTIYPRTLIIRQVINDVE